MTVLLPALLPDAPAPIPAWATPYLQELERTGLRSTAAASAGVTYQRVSKYAQSCVEFADAEAAAEERFADTLEAEAVRRARDGFDDPIYQKGGLVGYRRVYSDALMVQLLKGRRRKVYGDKAEIAHTGGVQVILAPIAQFDAIDTTTLIPHNSLLEELL